MFIYPLNFMSFHVFTIGIHSSPTSNCAACASDSHMLHSGHSLVHSRGPVIICVGEWGGGRNHGGGGAGKTRGGSKEEDLIPTQCNVTNDKPIYIENQSCVS